MGTTIQDITRSGRLARDQIRGVKARRIFGHRYSIPAFTTVSIWDGPAENYIFTDPLLNRIDTVSSSSISDSGQVEITGLDENWFEVIQTVTLDGRNKVGLSTPLIRFNGAIALANLIGEVYIYEDTAITNGIPDDLSKVKGYINPENNISKNLYFSVPVGTFINFKTVNYYVIPGIQCCVDLRFYIKYFNSADVLAYRTPIVSGGTTYVDWNVDSTAQYPEKSDAYATVTTTTPNSSLTAIAEFEMIRI
jgi:hypothetical protein